LDEKKNLRMLLSTLHEIWTTEVMWKEVSVEKMLSDDKYVSVYTNF
jgi:hypothetical protein